MPDIFNRIDTALVSNPAISCGLPPYASLLEQYKREGGNPDKAAQILIRGMVRLAGSTYITQTGGSPEVLEFSDGANQCLFDYTNERTVLMWGRSRRVAPNTRDNSYHGGYPRAGDGYDKGHALSHAQGGLEGGPNYFKQRASVNRRLSETGHLWRDIETFLAANENVMAFVRLIYKRGDLGEKPVNVEYSVFAGPGQFRSVIFPN